MYPSDEWLELLNFYLIVNSAGELSTLDFDDARLFEAYRENPSERQADMDAAASKLVLEFQAQRQDTELNNSPRLADAGSGGKEEIPDGFISISLPGM